MWQGMRNVIDSGMRSLEAYGRGRAGEPPVHANRAQALVGSLWTALNDHPRCRQMVLAELRALDPEVAADDPYRSLIRDLHERLEEYADDARDQPGVAMIHRIWLGRFLGEERLRSIAACNRHLSEIWQHPATRQPCGVRQVLWTDNREMLTLSRRYGRLEILPIAELLDLAPLPLRPHVRSFIRMGEYAFASDILRFLVLHQYGGLYLGIRWRHLDRGASRHFRFAPTRKTLRFMAVTGISTGSLTYPYTLEPDGRLRAVPFRIETNALVDSDILYVGKAGARLMASVLEVLQLVLSGMTGFPRKAHVIANHRHTKKWLLSKRDAAGRIDPQLASRHLQKNNSANVGGNVTNTFPLYMALLREGLCAMMSAGSHSTQIIPNEFFFYVPSAGTLVVRELDITRPEGFSWQQIPADYRPYSED